MELSFVNSKGRLTRIPSCQLPLTFNLGKIVPSRSLAYETAPFSMRFFVLAALLLLACGALAQDTDVFINVDPVVTYDASSPSVALTGAVWSSDSILAWSDDGSVAYIVRGSLDDLANYISLNTTLPVRVNGGLRRESCRVGV